MKTIRPIRLVKASSADLTEVEIWHRVNMLPSGKRSEVIDRLRDCDDPVLRERGQKLLRACYVV